MPVACQSLWDSPGSAGMTPKAPSEISTGASGNRLVADKQPAIENFLSAFRGDPLSVPTLRHFCGHRNSSRAAQQWKISTHGPGNQICGRFASNGRLPPSTTGHASKRREEGTYGNVHGTKNTNASPDGFMLCGRERGSPRLGRSNGTVHQLKILPMRRHDMTTKKPTHPAETRLRRVPPMR